MGKVEYDARRPVRPAFEERAVQDFRGRTRELWAGLAHVDKALDIVRRGDPVAVDIEAVGMDADAWKIKVVAFATNEMGIALDPRDHRQAAAIRELLDAAHLLVFQNGSYDVPPLVNSGLMELRHIDKVWDTIILARMAEPDAMKHDLASLVVRYITNEPATVDTKLRYMAAGVKSREEWFRYVDVDTPGYLIDNIMDTMATADLFRTLYESAIERTVNGHPFGQYGVHGAEAERLVYREQVVNRVMLKRSARGLVVDQDFLQVYRQDFEADLAAKARELDGLGIVPGNGNSLTTWLDNAGLLPSGYPRTPKTGKPSATAKNLETLNHPVVSQFIGWKEATKVQGYLEKAAQMAEVTGRIHPQVNILGAASTGRMSVSNPPYQQFPGPARGIIMADRGESLTSIDWTSVEPYLMACISKDRGLTDFYEAGGDIYQPIMERAGISRKRAKVVVLAQLYGQGIKALARSLGVSVEEAKLIRDAVLAAMPGVAAFSRQIKNVAGQYAKVVTISGRILPIPVFQGKAMEYMGVNYTVQGSAADVLAETIYSAHEAGLGDAIYLAMHDELVVETDAAPDIRKLMETAPAALDRWAGKATRLRTDMADLGTRWAAA